jgi:hypothetical protein
LAVDPEDLESAIRVLIPTHRLQWAARMGDGAVRELAESIPQVLAEPTHLYRGIMRDADDEKAGEHPGWLCYVGKPDRRYDLRSGEERSLAGRVLLVYVNAGRIVYNHRWEEEDEVIPGQPADLQDRFREQLK